MIGTLAALAAAGCSSLSVMKHDAPDYNGDGRAGFSDLHASRSDAAYAPADTRTPEQQLGDHMDRQKGGRAYERDRRDED